MAKDKDLFELIVAINALKTARKTGLTPSLEGDTSDLAKRIARLSGVNPKQAAKVLDALKYC